MRAESPSGIETAVFGTTDRAGIDGWLRRHLRERLDGELTRVLFRAGRVSAVYGAELRDGRRVAVKVHRGPADPAYGTAAVACQRRLHAEGYPCPEPLDGPAATGGRTAVVESLLTDGVPGDGHEAGVRRALARSLSRQVDVLRGTPVHAIAAGAPAWTRHHRGPWPEPHDPLFDFGATPPAFAWLDDLAGRAAGVLADAGPADHVAHADWSCGNLRFSGTEVVASFDWDSLAAGPEAVLAGMSAGSFPAGGTAGAAAPTAAEVAAFLRDYEDARRRRFRPAGWRTAAAAATWVLAYNARCEVCVLPTGGLPPRGSALHALAADPDGHLALTR